MKVQLVSKFSAMVRNFYQNCYKPAARFFEPVQQFSCSPGFSFHSRFVFRGSVVSLRSFGRFGGVFAPIFPVSYQVARVNFSKIPKSCKILTSFYCNHAFNVISLYYIVKSPYGGCAVFEPSTRKEPPAAFCAGAKAMSENAIAKMTMRQAEEEMACFRKIYSIVRLLDLKTMEENPCYAPWREAHPCTRCIGREALLCKGQKSKLEHVGSQIYQATARYVEVDGSPYIMEMIQPLEPDSDALSHEDKRLYTDALTGVYNRRFYEDELRHKFLTAGVAMIDLDDFKLCNDTFGHEAGDAALCAVASIIQHNIRSSDMLIRYGGDELLLILPMIPADDFARKLRLINQKLSGARVPGFERLRITSSIGGVLSAGVSIEEAVKLADKRMYQAKRQKNMVVTENEPQNVFNVQSPPRPTVLIVDDSPMNREILTEILGKDFQLLEASDGAQCMSLLKQFGSGISLVLLDIVMPDMDGFEVLARMAGQDLLNDLPVIMVSSEDSSTVIHRAYELGASDFIRRPFDARIVHRRVSNLTRLYARQRRLSRMVAQQFYEREKNNRLMIAILSQVTERHNGENGLHIQRIQTLTAMLLEQLVLKTDRYVLPASARSLITTASALHDIGKIAIDDAILKKKGPLTEEEARVMRTHPVLGAKMLEGLDFYQKEPLLQTAAEICRWHHERYDGSGYPDGLTGESIPIAAQVVGLADAYDTLTGMHGRVEAVSHEEVIHRLLNDERGSFNPVLLSCLFDLQSRIPDELEAALLTPPPREFDLSLI